MIEKVILGTVQLGLEYGINNSSGLPDEKEVQEIFTVADSAGITKLDTAVAYGKAEERIGNYNRSKNSFKIITKFDKEENFFWRESLKKSLDRMNVSNVETVLFHSFSDFQKNKDRIGEIVKIGKNKLFSTLGVSVYTNKELEELMFIEEIEVIQLPFNLLDNENQRSGIIKRLKEKGKIIHTRSCFLQGLFFMPIQKILPQLKPLIPYLEEIKRISENNNLEVGHLSLQYVLQKNYIDGVLFGVDSVSQIKKNIEWSEKIISADVLEQIDQINVIYPNLLNPAEWLQKK